MKTVIPREHHLLLACLPTRPEPFLPRESAMNLSRSIHRSSISGYCLLSTPQFLRRPCECCLIVCLFFPGDDRGSAFSECSSETIAPSRQVSTGTGRYATLKD